jgi:hypothetical protein
MAQATQTDPSAALKSTFTCSTCGQKLHPCFGHTFKDKHGRRHDSTWCRFGQCPCVLLKAKP